MSREPAGRRELAERYGVPADAELQAIADETGETIEAVRDLAEAMAVCADEGPSEARADRRQRAREAYYDATDLPEKFSERGLEEAIETATRVRITPEIIEAGYPSALTKRDRALCKPLIEAAFRAAGFEVEK